MFNLKIQTSMKLRSILIAALAALTFASCSKDENGVPPVPTEGKDTYMSITLNTVKANTRAHYGNVNVTDEEKAIGDVTLYIFDSTGFLEKTVTFDATDVAARTKTFTITTGEKTFLAAVNIPGQPTFANGTTSISKVKEAVMNVADIDVPAKIETPAADSRFWMTSLNDNTKATLVEITDPTAVGGTANDVTIPVGRVVAKVGVYYNPQSEPTDGALVPATVMYKAHNNPNKTMLFTSLNAAGNRVTPYFSTAGTYFNNTTYLPTTATFDSGDNKMYHDRPSYLMENSNASPTKLNTSFVMIKGEYQPTEVTDPDDASTAAPASGASFWRIAKVDGSGNRTGEYLPAYYSKDPDVAQNPSSTVTLAADEVSVEYVGGVAYYGLWLSNDQESGTVNRYTVKRNQYWSVEVTSVSGCGEPDEPGVTETPDPDLDAETYMTATIEVEAWEEVERPGGI